jgi:hypothetical protein
MRQWVLICTEDGGLQQAHGTVPLPSIIAHSDRLLSREKCIARGYKMSGAQSRRDARPDRSSGRIKHRVDCSLNLAHGLVVS